MIPAALMLPQEFFSSVMPPTIASATVITPTSAINYVSGTAQIATINPPMSGQHIMVLIFTDANPGTPLTSGNIASTVTPGQNTSTFFIYEPRLKKYFPVKTSSGGGGGGTPGGSNTDIQFNDNGSFGGSTNLTWNATGNGIRLRLKYIRV